MLLCYGGIWLLSTTATEPYTALLEKLCQITSVMQKISKLKRSSSPKGLKGQNFVWIPILERRTSESSTGIV